MSQDSPENEPAPILAARALSMWANFIESDDVCMSAIDAKKAGRPGKALSTDQMRLIVRLRDVALQYQRSATAQPPTVGPAYSCDLVSRSRTPLR